MSKKKQVNEEEVIVDIGGTYNRVEQYIENNKQTLSIIVLGAIALIGGYFGYNEFYMAPLEKEAADQIWKAQEYMQMDSLDLAADGDGNNLGFLEIIDEYGSTKAGNQAKYWMGVISYKQGNFEDAIDYMNEFSSSDVMLSAVALGVIGDSYVELDDGEQALDYYVKAARKNSNEFSSPIYLMKAGKLAEKLGEYDKAVSYYKEIEDKYSDTQEGREIAKFIARAEAMAAN